VSPSILEMNYVNHVVIHIIHCPPYVAVALQHCV